MRRTIRLKLQPSEVQAKALAQTSHEFTCAFNECTAIGWNAKVGNSTKLHHLTYYSVKYAHPLLVSDLIVQARVKAAEAIRSALVLSKKPKRIVSCPTSLVCPPRYDSQGYKVDWESQTVRLSTTNGRQSIRFFAPRYAIKYVSNSFKSADLLYRDGIWWLHIVVTLPLPEIEQTNDIVGVDLGLIQPAVISNNSFLGKKKWRAIESRKFKQRRALQKCGTKSAKRRLKMTRRAQARFRRDCDHILSKQIVQNVPPGGTIVLENLTNILKRVKVKRKNNLSRRIHSWSFAQIRSFIEYKAEERGCTVVAVDPRHTSQMCSRCGYTARNNRRSRGWFKCRKCEFQIHADLNAARNIAAKYHAGSSNAVPGGLSVMEPIVGAVDTGRQNPVEATRKLSVHTGSA